LKRYIVEALKRLKREEFTSPPKSSKTFRRRQGFGVTSQAAPAQFAESHELI